MDNRLHKLISARPGRVRKQDIPDLASALVGYWKGFGTVGVDTFNNITFVRLHGANFDVMVLEEDWVKILPLLQDGTLGSSVFPSPQFNKNHAPTGKDFGDPILYNRTLSTLTLLFKDAESYPTQVPQEPQVTAAVVPGLFAGFDASRPGSVSLSGNQVTVWKDFVQGQNAYQSNPASRPVYNATALNNLPGVEFNGAQWLDLPLHGLTDWSVLIVGRYLISVSQHLGGFLVAAGYNGSGAGLDCYVKQNSGLVPLPGAPGRLCTWLYGGPAPISPYNDAALPGEFRLLYWTQSSRNPGVSRARIGLNPEVDFASIVEDYNLSNEGWDPTRLLAGNPPPLKGAIGRYSGLLGGGPGSYLVGTICEIQIYNRVLSMAEHSRLASQLDTKWGGLL